MDETELKQLHLDRQFPDLSIGWLFLFGEYAYDALRYSYSGGMSFRKFMETMDMKNSHRTMVKVVDRIEYQSQQLLVNREYRDLRGRLTLAASLEEAIEIKCKRNGSLTSHGEAWFNLSRLFNDLYWHMLETGDGEVLLEDLKRARDAVEAAGIKRRR